MAKATDDDVLSAFLATPRTNNPKKSWFEKLPPEVQEKLRVLKRAFHANEVGGRTMSELFEFASDRFSVGAKDGAFKKWLREKD